MSLSGDALRSAAEQERLGPTRIDLYQLAWSVDEGARAGQRVTGSIYVRLAVNGHEVPVTDADVRMSAGDFATVRAGIMGAVSVHTLTQDDWVALDFPLLPERPALTADRLSAEHLERLTDALCDKVGLITEGRDAAADLRRVVQQVIVDTLLIAEGAVTVKDLS